MLSKVIFYNYINKAFLKEELNLLQESDNTEYLLIERLNGGEGGLTDYKVILLSGDYDSSLLIFMDHRSGEEFSLNINDYGCSWILLPID